MRFTKQNIESLRNNLEKMERFFAYKYMVERSEIGFVIKDKRIHLMVEGKLTESFIPQNLEGCAINETVLEITKGKY